MASTRLIRHAAAAALMVASAGACAGNLGNVLGGVLGGGTGSQSAQLSGTIRGVDTRSQQIAIQESNGQTVPVYYDNQTQVVYQNQNYSPTSLENGDRVTARVQATNSNTYYTDYVQVDQSVGGTGSGSVSNNVQLMQGTVRQVDRRNGLFTVDMNNGSTLTVTMPYNPGANDVNRFNNLRSGEFVRFYGTYLSSSQIQLRQFN
jgi:outer membrane lipoprotein SlyB